MDNDGKIYNIEIQRADEGAIPKRARFNTCLIDSREVAKGTDYKDFPEIWVIFITENDIFGAGHPIYHVNRTIKELNHQDFDDDSHIMYINGAYRNDDSLGLLMRDFFCSDPSKMHYQELANRADFFKNKSKGVNAMCEIMKKLMNEERDVAIDEVRTNTAIEMLRDNVPMEKIVKYSQLPQERIEKLAQQIR
ncbi:PD-(D/E)XK nuclease family transposase [Selenomonas sp. KH1T6]|uniref:PD-(D/E)XK nuclease family transposase n=1 Tax=Selenomonas sp. KH1T6 TaxID=3158784 RepID=UPI00296F6477